MKTSDLRKEWGTQEFRSSLYRWGAARSATGHCAPAGNSAPWHVAPSLFRCDFRLGSTSTQLRPASEICDLRFEIGQLASDSVDAGWSTVREQEKPPRLRRLRDNCTRRSSTTWRGSNPLVALRGSLFRRLIPHLLQLAIECLSVKSQDLCSGRAIPPGGFQHMPDIPAFDLFHRQQFTRIVTAEFEMRTTIVADLVGSDTVQIYRSGDVAWTVGDHGSRAHKKEDCCNTGSNCVH